MGNRDTERLPTDGSSNDRDLVQLIECWSSEVGQPTLRPSWGRLKQRLSESREDVEQTYRRLEVSVSSESSLLLILALTQPATALRHQLLRNALLKLIGKPCHRVLGTLLFLPPDEIRENLAPLVYSRGVQGQRAAYLMARLNLSLNAEAVRAILDLEIHDRSFLINLSHLVEPAVRLSLRQSLLQDQPPPTGSPPAAQIDTFCEYLLDGPPGDPISPDATSTVPSNETPGTPEPSSGTSLVTPEPIAQSPGDTVPVTQIAQRLEKTVPVTSSVPLCATGSGSSERKEAQSSFLHGDMFGISKRRFWPYFIGISLGLLILGLLVSGSETEGPARYQPLSSQAPAPEYWIDAVSRQRVTRSFLKADSDFQMGEIFANRGDFSSALKLFQDALTEYPAHVGARFREGFCLMQMQDYKGAATSFRKVLAHRADYPLVNLYLGRIALVNFEPDKAAEHLQKEYALRKDLRVGIEYSRLLNQLGKFPESIQILSDLHRRFPTDLAVSSMLTFAQEQMKGK
ncbi:MAG TPA: tetratricopeptide repeat protein [Candidatus Ozemobacteraceae bacterium]|nr:tetratricopeptide repeat protein [Candidatus Ozemobacteraceae bacterium]